MSRRRGEPRQTTLAWGLSPLALLVLLWRGDCPPWRLPWRGDCPHKFCRRIDEGLSPWIQSPLIQHSRGDCPHDAFNIPEGTVPTTHWVDYPKLSRKTTLNSLPLVTNGMLVYSDELYNVGRPKSYDQFFPPSAQSEYRIFRNGHDRRPLTKFNSPIWTISCSPSRPVQ